MRFRLSALIATVIATFLWSTVFGQGQQKKPAIDYWAAYDTLEQARSSPRTLCTMVDSWSQTRTGVKDLKGKPIIIYHYKPILLKAAGVTREDSQEVVNKKVQKFWSERYEELFLCNPDSTFPRSIIRIAIAKGFSDFITDITRWGVDLNRIDEDGKTALDYLTEKRSRETEGSSVDLLLKRFVTQLVDAGAKHANEIK